ncbi:hypothetical protein BOX15_Mlig008597g1 [Macrostomum lignano]|uniref:Uncharacterized protein n=1 Tax=Macrostomum lignano TaxID=282301 RepID=A0A267DFR6_9PLAT|nr:hypothetical protein BOX15_Mlig008597g2 [Macrostomum lignano]PAA89496.1 hypothetical protein BOX15_Mlig008597g1 [Macrostomum lignano]
MTASRLYQKLYTGGLFSALALAIIACVTPGWGVVWDPRYGTTTSRMLALDSSVNGRAVIAMALIGTICLSISLLANVLTMAVKSLNDSNVPSIISFSALALGAICMLIALCVFGDRLQVGGYSLWFLSGSGILAAETTLLGVIIAANS